MRACVRRAHEEHATTHPSRNVPQPSPWLSHFLEDHNTALQVPVPPIPRCRAGWRRFRPAPAWGWDPPRAHPRRRCWGHCREVESPSPASRCGCDSRALPADQSLVREPLLPVLRIGGPPAIHPSAVPPPPLRSPPPRSHPRLHTPVPFPPSCSGSSVASLLPSPFSSPAQEFSHHPLAEGMSSPTPTPAAPACGAPSRHALPTGTLPAPPGPRPHPGCPSPAPAEAALCTHPLPAAVALSLETGSDSGSITFSALSLSGNFCGNPSEKGEQAGLWVHPSRELSSLPL